LASVHSPTGNYRRRFVCRECRSRPVPVLARKITFPDLTDNRQIPRYLKLSAIHGVKAAVSTQTLPGVTRWQPMGK